MIEILEKVSDQIRKVENACSGSIPVIEGEYYTPPVGQMKMNKPNKFSAPPNLPILDKNPYQVLRDQLINGFFK